MEYQTKLEAITLKVVVIKSPKFLSGILRMVFRIKKEESAE